MSRAFKPLPVILDLIDQKFTNYKNLILFMGETGIKTLDEALKKWDFEYKKKRSLTNKNSFVLNIKNIKKK